MSQFRRLGIATIPGASLLSALSVLLVTTAMIGAAPAAYAQAISVNGGSIQGTITDSSGSVLAGATVRIAGTDTGSTATVKTDGSG